MGNFNNNRFDRGRSGDSRSTTPPQMHSAICSKCGKSCLVPFKPTGNRPIFCSDCFRADGGATPRRSDERDMPASSIERRMYDAVCSNCGNRCQIPFQPRPGKEVFCSHCFEKKERGDSFTPEKPRTSDDFARLNAKLDRILELLTPAKVVTEAPTKTILEEETEAVIEEMVEKAVKKTPTKKKAAPKKKPSAK